MVQNAILAVAAGRVFGVSLEDCAAGLASTPLTKARLQLREIRGIHFLDDSYNANPESMKAALRTLMELDADGQRIAYGPVTADRVEALAEAALFAAGPHALRLGRVEDLPYFAKQQRLTFARVGVIEPCSVDEYVAHGGFAGLDRALTLPDDHRGQG